MSNSRIYPEHLFRKEINRYLNKYYCPKCFQFRLSEAIWTASQIPTKYIENRNKCDCCGKVCEPVTKEEMRKLKITKLLNG